MSNVFDQIATVSVGIQTAATSSASFGKLLIVGALPKVAPTKAPAPVGYYTSFEEVTEAGWVGIGEANAIDPVGAAALAAFSQDPKPEGIYIAAIQTTTVEETTTPEYAVKTVERALDTDGWYVVCPAGVANSELGAIAELIETQEKMMVYNETGFFGAGTGGTDAPTVSSIYTRTAGVYAKENSAQAEASIPAVNRYGMNAAFTAAWLVNASGSETAAYKRLYGVYPSTLTGTERTSLETNCLNFFQTVGNKNVTMIGKVLANEWMDIIRFRDWLKNDMQTRLVNLFLTLPKVPYTDGGIGLIHNAIEASLKAGQDAGGISPTEYDDDGYETLGYEVKVPRSVNIADSDKALRVLNNITFRARLAGAIHVAHITGTLAYSL